MEYGWYEGSRKCYERLSNDFLEVKKIIEEGDLDSAYERWSFTLMDSNHSQFRSYITETIFRGISFNAYAIMLRDVLEKKDKHRINFCVQGLQAMVAQEQLRSTTLSKNSELARDSPYVD